MRAGNRRPRGYVRIDNRHHRGGYRQGIKSILAAPQLTGKNCQPSHDGGTHDRGGGSHQDGVKDNPNDGSDGATACVQTGG